MKGTTISYILLCLSAIGYAALAYFTPREQFTQLLLLYTVLFAFYVYTINQKIPVWHGITAAILLRLVLLAAVPNLSDDYFRFVWDGRLTAAGISPYLHLPSYYIGTGAPAVPGISLALYEQLNSPSYFSVYPPLLQAVFWLAAGIAGGNMFASIVVMRIVLLLAETGSILLLLRILRKMGLSDKHVFLYALNPLVIIELTGNLHFEALLIFFLLLTFYLLFYQRHLLAGVAFGAAVATKLLPLMFLPFVLRRLGWQKFLLFLCALLLTVVLLFYPLVSQEIILNILQSINLYFLRFEFNASFYYLLRWLGFALTGTNWIYVLGPLLSCITLLLILALASSKRLGSLRRMAGYMAAALTIYLLLSTTVHPWYITTLVALTAMSNFRYAIVWSGLAILSYAAYRTASYEENLGLVALEYTVVFFWLLVELHLYRQHRRLQNLKD